MFAPQKGLPRQPGQAHFDWNKGGQLSYQGKAPFLPVRVPARQRRIFYRRGNFALPGTQTDCRFNLARLSTSPKSFRIPAFAGVTVMPWSPRAGTTGYPPFHPKAGDPPALRSSDNAIFLISAPFWAVLGRFVSGKWVGWRPGGPKMGRFPDRKRVDRVGHSGPFWAVLGHFPGLSQGDVRPPASAARGPPEADSAPSGKGVIRTWQGQVVNGPWDYGREGLARASRGRCHPGNNDLKDVMLRPWARLSPPAKGGHSTGADAEVSKSVAAIQALGHSPRLPAKSSDPRQGRTFGLGPPAKGGYSTEADSG